MSVFTETNTDLQLAYWKQQLKGAPPLLQLPIDYPRKQVQTFDAATISLILPQPLFANLKALSKLEGVTLFTLLLAAFKTLLYRYTEQDDILVGTPVANHNQSKSGLISANTLVLRTNFSGSLSFQELLIRVQEVMLEAYAHQDLPLEQLVEELQVEGMSHTPFQVMFHLNDAPKQAVDIQSLKVDDFEVASRIAQFDLSLEIVQTEELSCLFEYNTDLFDATTIERMLGHYRTLLEGIVANPEQQILTLPLLTDVERHQMLVEWNNTTITYPQDQCVHQLIEAQVEQTPDAIALIFEDQQLTYKELNARANQVAHFLKKCGIGPDVFVGISMERSWEIVVGILGILKSGGAYVPLDPMYPKERLTFMLEDTQVPVLLTQQRVVEGLPTHSARVVCLDIDWNVIAQESEQNPISEATPQNLAYAIYTSGSTGRPKGVKVTLASVRQYVLSVNNELHINPDDVYLHMASFSFASSVRQLMVPLSQGAKVLIATYEQTRSPLRIFNLIQERGITVCDTVQSYWQYGIQALEALEEVSKKALLKSNLRLIVFCGELLTWELPKTLHREFEYKPPMVNLYALTETTSVCSYRLPNEFNNEVGPVPVGRPVANVQIYILNSQLQPVPLGVPGELHVGGSGLACGYLHRSELTDEKFISNPFSDDPTARIHKTGDLARYLPSGNIEILGRIDDQVQLRGMRIELGEIEAVLSQHSAVRTTVVIAREDVPGDQRLVAYVVHNHGQELMFSELRSFLRAKLPEYMVPSAFVLLSALPLNPNGKVNRRALPAPDPTKQKPQSIVAPRDLLEDQLKEIWQEVLGIETIGIKDNFFDLGGHSLLAMRLVAQIEKISGKNIPLATLLQAPTVEQLANLLRQEEWSAPWRSLVAIHPDGSQPPLFCIHPIGGTVLFYQRLVRYLPGRPIYGLQARGMDGSKTPYTEVVDMAAHYIKEIHTIQPEGPYFLGGFSFGGLVAFEMAQQLQAQGQKVALLALFDTQGRGHLKQTLLSRSVYHLNKLLELGPNYILDRTKANIQRIQDRVKGRMPEIVRELGLDSEDVVPDALRRVFEANLQATQDYVPQVYSGRVDLFRAIYERAPEGWYFDPQLGWGSLAIKGVEIHEVPSHHHSLFSEPQIQALAEKLKACLEQSQADNGVAKKANRLLPHF